MIVFDHTYPLWNAQRTKTNGAFTYSKDIVKNYLPVLQQKEIDQNIKILVSTATQLNKCTFDFVDDIDLAVQFLHKYPYGEPTEKKQIQDVLDWLKVRKFNGRTIFVSSYQAYVDKINKWFAGQAEAVFIPMTVDMSGYDTNKQKISRHENRVIWFGNSYADKNKYLNTVAQWLVRSGCHLDIIQNGAYNYSTPIESHSQMYDILSQYKYGIGVGRCAIEMIELGLNVVVCGQHFGGAITDTYDYQAQVKNNFNGRTITYDREISTCLDWLVNTKECAVPFSFNNLNIKYNKLFLAKL